MQKFAELRGEPCVQSLPSGIGRWLTALVFHRNVILGEHDPRGFAGGARPQLELHRGFARAAGARQIGGERPSDCVR